MIELNTIYNEDCLEGMKRIPDKSVDMILCDLPYGTTACKWDTIIPLDKLWDIYNRIISDNGAVVLNANQPFTTVLINSNFKNFCYSWVWNKKFGANFVQEKRQPLRTCEDILVFSKNGKMPFYNPQKTIRDIPIKKGGNKQSEAIPIAKTQHALVFGQTEKIYTDKFPEMLIEHNVRDGRGLPPTQKPVALFEYLIKTYTNESETVLDNCIGSGTTAIACINTNRNYIGFELDQTYFNLANERIENHKKDRELK